MKNKYYLVCILGLGGSGGFKTLKRVRLVSNPDEQGKQNTETWANRKCSRRGWAFLAVYIARELWSLSLGALIPARFPSGPITSKDVFQLGQPQNTLFQKRQAGRKSAAAHKKSRLVSSLGLLRPETSGSRSKPRGGPDQPNAGAQAAAARLPRGAPSPPAQRRVSPLRPP